MSSGDPHGTILIVQVREDKAWVSVLGIQMVITSCIREDTF